jgi:hypothetical protein
VARDLFDFLWDKEEWASKENSVRPYDRHTPDLRSMPIMIQFAAPLFVVLPWTLFTGSLGIDPAGSSQEVDAARVKRLINQLDSPKFAERQAAAKELRKVGEPAVPALREAARRDESLESRRRAEALIQTIRQDTVKRLVSHLESLNSSMQRIEKELRKIGKPAVAPLQEATRDNADFHRRVEGLLRLIEQDEFNAILKQAKDAEQKKHYQSAAAILSKAIDDLKARIGNASSGDVPLLTEAFMRLAGVRRKMGDFTGAAQAYDRATYYSNYNREKRLEIERECEQMLADLMPRWEKAVRKNIGKNPALKALTAKYPLVLLHSRRFAGGGYLQSAYSFIYETADEKKHFNDVQLLFDNGRGDRTFQVNMLGGQRNTVADLGAVDFEADSLKMPRSKDAGTEATAINNHVYLEKVEDSQGNSFLVVFQVIAVDPANQYMAFIWRRLPGGKIVRRN